MASMKVTIESPKNAAKLGVEGLKAKVKREQETKPQDEEGDKNA